MDAYAYVLQHLRERDCARLRAYADGGPARFSTWLVVVARRLCVDWRRSRYGRVGRDGPASSPLVRRRLEDLISAAIDPDMLAESSERSPDHEMLHREIGDALSATLERLPPRDRLLLALRFEDDQSAATIARLLDFPTPFHVYRHLNGLLRRLRHELHRRGIDSSG